LLLFTVIGWNRRFPDSECHLQPVGQRLLLYGWLRQSHAGIKISF
jgi:hypothetical protein